MGLIKYIKSVRFYAEEHRGYPLGYALHSLLNASDEKWLGDTARYLWRLRRHGGTKKQRRINELRRLRARAKHRKALHAAYKARGVLMPLIHVESIAYWGEEDKIEASLWNGPTTKVSTEPIPWNKLSIPIEWNGPDQLGTWDRYVQVDVEIELDAYLTKRAPEGYVEPDWDALCHDATAWTAAWDADRHAKESWPYAAPDTLRKATVRCDTPRDAVLAFCRMYRALYEEDRRLGGITNTEHAEQQHAENEERRKAGEEERVVVVNRPTGPYVGMHDLGDLWVESLTFHWTSPTSCKLEVGIGS